MASLPLRPNDPAHLGQYKIEARLGAGGMGMVYLGRTPEGRPVAIKVVRSEYTRDEEFLGRFRSEVNRARQVPPFCTAEVLDADLDHEPPYLVVEYVDGPDLADVVREQGPLAPAALYSAAVGIATALTAIHGAGVIHRDLKPGNVLFALGGLKVIDFGIARPLEATSQHTRTDQMVGTVAYMAPERFDEHGSQRVGTAADIFAWGAVVTFAATGRTPFQADSPPATAMRILTQPPALDGLPGPLRGIVERTLAKDPADRPTARELLDLLLAATGPASSAGAGSAAASLATPGPAAPGPAAGGLAGAGSAAGGFSPGGSAGAGSLPGGPAAAGFDQGGSLAAGAAAAGAMPVRPVADDRDRAAAGGLVPAGTPQPVLYGQGQPPAGTQPRPGRLARPISIAVLVLAVLAGGGLYAGHRLYANGSGPAGQPGATATVGPTTTAAEPTSPAPEPVPTGNPAILAGTRRTLIHFVEIDKDLAMPWRDEVKASDGTGKDAIFALVPTGVDYLIKSFKPDEQEQPCLGVKVIPGRSGELVGTDCAAKKATLFSVSPTGKKDDHGRPTYTFYNDAYGTVQWSDSRSEVYVEFLGDADPPTTFSFVDRGPL